MARAPARLAVVLLLLAALGGCAGQSDEAGASIVQTTQMGFRLTGSAAGNFSQSAQSQFSDQLRALVQQFHFMSIAVSDVAPGDGYADITVRIVDATNGVNLTQAWQTIASQVLVTNTFVTTFNALLTNAGLKGTAALTSVAGAASPASVNVSFAVHMQLSGGSALPFTEAKQQQFLTPITTFLGDRGTATIGNASEAGNSAGATLQVSLDANAMPQFWFFVSNQSALQAALPQLGGSALSTSLTGHTYIGEQGSAPAPSSGAFASPPVSEAQAQGPVTAAQASGSPPAPPVSSASGTATIAISMTLYGSDVQPFTPDVQFAAASSLAGVFWIVVGTGSVQLLSYNSTTSTSMPSSTAKAGQPEYGRKLLQAANAPATGPIPAENVVFGVTLPSATQNSLLVLQSASPTVRKQFAGWFVTQMQERGYNVSTDVTGVNLRAVTAPAPAGAAAAAAPSDSTNVGAIVGGVVGGVCALGLIALLAVWLHHRNQRRRDLAVKEAALGRDSDDFGKAGFWGTGGKGYDVYTKDADALKKTIYSTLSNGTSLQSSEAPLYRSPIYSRITELDSAHVDDVKRLLHKRKQKESRPLTETSEHQAAALLSALSSLEPGSLYYDKYVVEQGQRRGVNSIIAHAHVRDAADQQVVIKFVPDHGLYKHEKVFYENRVALEGAAAAEFIPALFDAFSGVEEAIDDDSIPPSLVLERGNFTLADWLSGKAVASVEGKPQEIDRTRTLLNLCRGVEFLHARNLVHGGLAPSAVAWFAPQQRWKLLSFGNWARSKELLRVNYSLRYAAPELLLADLAGMQQLAAAEATDMWALGCIAFELLSGREIFGDQYSEEEIMSMLLGFVKLPWEENPDFFADNLPPEGRAFVSDLLQRAPEARKPIRTALLSPMFGTAPAVVGPQTELRTPAGIMSTASEWA